VKLQPTALPFDWNIMLPSALSWMSEEGRLFPSCADEMMKGVGGEPTWPFGRAYWHDFKIKEQIRVDDTFDETKKKYDYLNERLLATRVVVYLWFPMFKTIWMR